MKKLAITIIALLAFSASAWAHSGGTNAQGCHMNHKTGDYHCHSKKTP